MIFRRRNAQYFILAFLAPGFWHYIVNVHNDLGRVRTDRKAARVRERDRDREREREIRNQNLSSLLLPSPKLLQAVGCKFDLMNSPTKPRKPETKRGPGGVGPYFNGYYRSYLVLYRPLST